MFEDFIERWICCGRVDDDDVVFDLATVRKNPDCLAESIIAYTHDPIVRHVSAEPAEIWAVDNEVCELMDQAQADPAEAPGPCGADAGGEGSTDPHTDAMVVYVPVEAVAARPAAEPVQIRAEVEEAGVNENAITGPSSVYRVCQDVVEVKRHRRLPHPKRGDYVACIVSDIKNRLGCPAPNAANLLAVRRMAKNSIEGHGLRPTHARTVIEKVIAGVFVPDEYDLASAKILQSVGMRDLRAELNNAGPRSVWHDLFHPFERRGADRVRATTV
jgi:hypothetical protein